MMPAEVVELISSGLKRQDLLALRSICRDLDEKTLRCVERVCIRIFQTDLCSKSLQKLKEISEDERFRHFVRCLCVPVRPSYNKPGVIVHFPRDPYGRMKYLPPGVEMLGKILLDGLVNCRSFCIHQDDGKILQAGPRD